jgi:hypothetical protein
MKPFKIIICAMIIAAITLFALAQIEAEEKSPFLKDYQVVEVQPFEVPPNAAAPDSAGRAIADEIVYQTRKYSHKDQLFDMVIIEGTYEVSPGKKILLIQGTVNEYNSYPKSPVGSTCDVDCKFVDKASGQILLEFGKNKAVSVLPGDELLDFEGNNAQSEIGKLIAKLIYRNKVGKK